MKALTSLAALLLVILLLFCGCAPAAETAASTAAPTEPGTAAAVPDTQTPETRAPDASEGPWVCTGMTKHIYDDMAGEIVVQERYEYDEEGRQILLEYEDSRTESFYEDGCLIRTESWMGEELWKTEEYVYDEFGFRVQSVVRTGDGEIELVTDITTDKAGRPIRETMTLADGTPYGKLETLYDTEGRRIRQLDYLGDNSLPEYTSEWIYDETGRMTESLSYRGSPAEDGYLQYLYEYDEADRLIRAVCYNGDGEICETRETAYDENGNPETLTVTRGDGSLYILEEYTYAILP